MLTAAAIPRIRFIVSLSFADKSIVLGASVNSKYRIKTNL
jgi:hypothetical protein